MIEWSKHIEGECEKIEEVPKGAIIEAVDGKDCYGLCEVCLTPIIEGDKYYSDEDGIIIHTDCMDA